MTLISKTRLEAFSDGVIAIIITIMVFKIKAPQGDDFTALVPLIPIGLSYLLSFIYLGVYWNNHHHLLVDVKDVNGSILWANLHFLFWLSLLPVVTGWMGDNRFAPAPVASYGIIQLMIAVGYFILQNTIKRHHGMNSLPGKALRNDQKATASLFLYVIAIGTAFIDSWIAGSIYLLVALMWLLPDRKTKPAPKEIRLK